jgi:benzoate/toluate 1,2-dioxygenase subunit alpha
MNEAVVESDHPQAARDRLAQDLVDDRLLQGQGFRVDRRIYTDEQVFDLEMRLIYERNWVFLCHESQISKHGDYFSTHIGRQPVLVVRDKDGSIKGFINACAHRGALLTDRRQGNATTLRCRFHGWCYNTQGRCTRIKNEESGWPGGVDREQFSLKRVAHVASYGSFVFGCLEENVAPLEEYLGRTIPFIDLLADQSPQGMEIVGGSSDYIIQGNWKMQAENGVDGYHVSTVHRVFASAMLAREERQGLEGMAKTEAGRIAGQVETGCYDLGGGHMMIWAGRSNPQAAPLWEARDRLLATYSPEKVKWMIERGRNLFLFPNVQLMDQPSTQIRIFRPLSVDRTQVTVFCIAPKGESDAARTARIRKFEDFYMVTGMATPDDLAALKDCQAGAHGEVSRWTEITRGLANVRHGADEHAAALGAEPVTSNSDWDAETLYYSFYRRWRECMTESKE